MYGSLQNCARTVNKPNKKIFITIHPLPCQLSLILVDFTISFHRKLPNLITKTFIGHFKIVPEWKLTEISSLISFLFHDSTLLFPTSFFLQNSSVFLISHGKNWLTFLEEVEELKVCCHYLIFTASCQYQKEYCCTVSEYEPPLFAVGVAVECRFNILKARTP